MDEQTEWWQMLSRLYTFLMDLAKETQGWPQMWQMGILDIERRTCCQWLPQSLISRR